MENRGVIEKNPFIPLARGLGRWNFISGWNIHEDHVTKLSSIYVKIIS